tara:strand:- start:2373 stop:4391 length:2019 start_codon:yes stop_codon:yes gene_type:complete
MGRFVGLTHNRHNKGSGGSSNILRTTEYESVAGITTDSDNNVTEITLGENKYEDVKYNNVGLITSYVENIGGNSITYNLLYDAAGIVTSIQEFVPPIPTYTFVGIPTSISEGSTGIVTVQVTGMNPSSVLYWDITNPADFTTSSGNFSLDSNAQGTVSIGPLADQLTEGPETFVFRVRTGSTTGAIVTTSDPITINDTSNTPTFALTPPSSIDEGSAGLITCTTTDIFDGTTLYWDVIPTTDFTASDGSVTVNSNSADIYVTPDADQTTEGPETFQLKLYTDAARTVNVATSSSITINDSSQTLAYAFSNVPSSMNEGQTINLTVTTLNTPDGTTLYWDILGGSGVNSSDFAVYQDSITVNNNTSLVQISTANDNSSSEGTETFQVRLFTDSARTNQVAIASTITINDTSFSPQVVYQNAGTYSWICPAGVTSVCVVCVGGGGKGGGGGGGGGGLGWKNNISVTAGQSYTVVVGARGSDSANGGNSYFISTGTVAGYGGNTATSSLGTNNTAGGSYVGDGGGSGGNGSSSNAWGGGGGGAGGYSGNGGSSNTVSGNSGSGGGGGGGAGHSSTDSNDGKRKGGGGGGVGLLGQGSSGAGAPSSSYGGDGGYGGSGGANGTQSGAHAGGAGGNYGGGGGGSNDTSGGFSGGPGKGAVRIIWGSGRSFPSNAGDI